MKKLLPVILCGALLVAACNRPEPVVKEVMHGSGPIRLHPENPHYFQYKGKTLALITSAEHYGALINLDFDYRVYLEALSAAGMNYTRIFTGTYFEIPGVSFGIRYNTLAPEKDEIITPWAVVITDLSGEVKYDLSAWNNAYFDRLKDFMALAADHDIIVEVTLFSSIYRDDHWAINPQNPANNINIRHEVTRFNAHTLNNGSLFNYQASFVRKMVQELNGFENFFFEIQNEPWADHPVPVYNIVNREDLRPEDWTYKADFATEESMAWQEKLASVIVEEEKSLSNKHLIARNYTNFKAPIPVVSDHISIINFHYAWPEAVEWNYQYDRVIGFDESGFAGPADQVYRRQAWQFMLSGGGLFNNLDYSFFAGHEEGTGENQAPGGGSHTFRKQLRILSEFLHSFALEKLQPDPSCIESSPGLIPYVLSDRNKAYAVFLRAVGTKNTTLRIITGDGIYRVQTLNSLTGEYTDPLMTESRDGIIEIAVVIPEGELALRIIREE